MGMVKNYYLAILEACSDQELEQDAVEYALMHGRVTLTGDLETDVRNIKRRLADFVDHWQRIQAENNALLWESYLPILEETLHPTRLP